MHFHTLHKIHSARYAACDMDTDLLKTLLEGMLKELGFACQGITVSEEEGGITRVDIESNEASKIIGWHGETLNSIKHMLKAIMRTKEQLDRSPFIVLDVDGYRRAQEDKVRGMAARKADFVRRTGNRVALPPMSPYFRRLVHLHVSNSPELQDLTTVSSGEGDYRQIVLRLKDESQGGSGDGGEELSPVIDEQDKQDADSLDNLDI